MTQIEHRSELNEWIIDSMIVKTTESRLAGLDQVKVESWRDTR